MVLMPGRAAPVSSISAPPSEVASIGQELFEKSEIAALTRQQIDEMNQEQLIRVIRGANMPLIRANVDQQLDFREFDILRRLAYLARRCCRNQGY